MKTRFFGVLAAIAVIAGCAKEVNHEAETPSANGKRQVTITANIAQTKTTVSDEGMYSWQNTEKIGVVETDGTGVIPFTVQDATAGTFTGELTEDKEPVFAVSPASVVSDVTEVGGMVEYTITFDNISNYVPGTTNALMIGTKPTAGSENSYSFEFRHAAALVKVPVVNVPVGTAKVKLTMDKPITGIWEDLDSTSPVIGPDETLGDNSVVLTLKDEITDINTSADFYFPVPVNTYGSFQFELLDADGNRIKGVKKSGLEIDLVAADLFITPTLTLDAVPVYRKVTQDSELREGGQYLIVYEDSESPVAFDGSLDALDAVGNGVAVTINNNTIVSTTTLDASSFTISIENGTILSASGNYIGITSNSNGLSTSTSADDYSHTFEIDSDGNAVVKADFQESTMTLRYNKASNQTRFRYYKSGQEAIALYVKDGTGSAVIIKEEAGIYYNEADAAPAITIGDGFTAPTLQNPNNLDVTYSSSNTDVATVVADGDGEGTVTIVGAGVTTITASFAGNDTYKAGTASYTLTVAPALEVVAVAQFLEKEVNTTSWYQLTGKVTNIVSTTYGNFTLVDASGSVYVYGLTKTQQSSNNQSFASIGLKEGDIVTINTLRSEHSGTAQAGGSIPAYYVSHVPAPEISVTPATKTVLAAGSTFNVTVTSNCAWTISGDGFTANPSTGTSGETEVEITVPARTVADDDSITATIAANDDSNVTATVNITQHGTDYTAPAGWVETALADIEAGDIFVIVSNNGSNYAMSNDKGTSSAPSAVAVTVANGKITSAVDDNIKWNLTVSSGSYTFYPNGSTTTWLYTTNDNNGVRVGTNDNKSFTIYSDYLFNTATSRYIGVYSSQDWRCYNSINSNIANQTFKFYKYFDDGKTDAGIAYNPTSDEITEGDDLTQPALNNPYGLTVSYESDNTNVATVTSTGEISVVGVGTAVITASWEEQTIGGVTYRADSATYTLTVNEDTGETPGTPKTSTLTFTAKCNGSGTADDGVAWTVTSDGTESNFDSTKGIHYGTNNAAVQYIKLKTSDISGTISKVVVNASAASGVSATASVTVGGSAFGGDAQSLTTSAANYTFNGSASGEIIVTITKPSSATKAIYVKSVTVTYTPSN